MLHKAAAQVIHTTGTIPCIHAPACMLILCIDILEGMTCNALYLWQMHASKCHPSSCLHSCHRAALNITDFYDICCKLQIAIFTYWRQQHRKQFSLQRWDVLQVIPPGTHSSQPNADMHCVVPLRGCGRTAVVWQLLGCLSLCKIQLICLFLCLHGKRPPSSLSRAP